MTIELADVFNRFADSYLSRHGASVLPSHRRAIVDIRNCRTEELGGHLYCCNHCGEEVFAYHSCKNRHCPKCHGEQTGKWLEQRQNEMLPTQYFHITVTIPKELREIFRSNQKVCYSLLMSVTGKSLLQLAKQVKHVGGILGILAVLHTWTRDLLYHPHLHCLVTGGGISEDGRDWVPAKHAYLLPYQPLAQLIRGKLMDALRRELPHVSLPKTVWDKEWVIHCTPWGKGEKAILDYLARYAFRIAINNSRLVSMDETTVTFRFRKRDTGEMKTRTLSGEEFIRRFLQHVLPQGFHKIRYFGLWHPTNREKLERVRLRLLLDETCEPEQGGDVSGSQITHPKITVHEGAPCQTCSTGALVLVKTIRRRKARDP